MSAAERSPGVKPKWSTVVDHLLLRHAISQVNDGGTEHVKTMSLDDAATQVLRQSVMHRTSAGGTCDEYGFLVPDSLVGAFRKHSETAAGRRQAVRDQWSVLRRELQAQGAELDASVSSRVQAVNAYGLKTRSARKLLRGPVIHGVPPDMRAYCWPLLCGVEKARAAKGEHVYPQLLQRSEGKRDCNKDLELDLDRTFPGHPLLDRESAHGASPVLVVVLIALPLL